MIWLSHVSMGIGFLAIFLFGAEIRATYYLGDMKRAHIYNGIVSHLFALSFLLSLIADIGLEISIAGRVVDSLLFSLFAYKAIRWWKDHNDYWKRFKRKVAEKVEALASGRLVTVPTNG